MQFITFILLQCKSARFAIRSTIDLVDYKLSSFTVTVIASSVSSQSSSYESTTYFITCNHSVKMRRPGRNREKPEKPALRIPTMLKTTGMTFKVRLRSPENWAWLSFQLTKEKRGKWLIWKQNVNVPITFLFASEASSYYRKVAWINWYLNAYF